MDIPFVKGHGTRNDFVLVPDASGRIELGPAQVARLCDRRGGIGGDGVIRVVRTDATEDPAAVRQRDGARWFMDYRNSDGSLSEMCGNGIRVLALYLATHADIDPREPLPIATRAGLRTVRFSADDSVPGGVGITVDMGSPEQLGRTEVEVAGRRLPAEHVSMGNPHAVAFVDDLAEAGDLGAEPGYDPVVYPDGVNVELVRRVGAGVVEMRVHERGSGETQSCGTGACAVMVATAAQDGAPRGTAYDVRLPGGELRIVWTEAGRVEMTGPAELVGEGLVRL